MTRYDASRFVPPAPVAEVALRSAGGGKTVSGISLLLDTGADVTLLPRAAIEGLGIPAVPGQRYELMAFDVTTSFAPAVVLDVIFLNRVFRGRYLLIDEECGILGRDVLNHVALLLDGPRREWAEHHLP